MERWRALRGISCLWTKERKWRCMGMRPSGEGERVGDQVRDAPILPGPIPPSQSHHEEVVEEEEDVGERYDDLGGERWPLLS